MGVVLGAKLLWGGFDLGGVAGIVGLRFANPTYGPDPLALFLIAACARDVWAVGLFYGNFSWYPARGWIAALTVIARSG